MFMSKHINHLKLSLARNVQDVYIENYQKNCWDKLKKTYVKRYTMLLERKNHHYWDIHPPNIDIYMYAIPVEI